MNEKPMTLPVPFADIEDKTLPIAFRVYIANPPTADDRRAVEAAIAETQRSWSGFTVQVLPIARLVLSNNRAPILFGFTTALQGAESICAYFARVQACEKAAEAKAAEPNTERRRSR